MPSRTGVAAVVAVGCFAPRAFAATLAALVLATAGAATERFSSADLSARFLRPLAGWAAAGGPAVASATTFFSRGPRRFLGGATSAAGAVSTIRYCSRLPCSFSLLNPSAFSVARKAESTTSYRDVISASVNDAIVDGAGRSFTLQRLRQGFYPRAYRNQENRPSLP